MIDADWTSYHIEGYARAAIEKGLGTDGAYFKAPLMSEILPNLWVGGCIGGVKLPEDFKHVVSLYKWQRYELGPDTHRLEVEMYDSGDIPDVDQLNELADAVNRYREEGKTLVHCQAGLNRSGLVTTLALIKSGMGPAEAIALLREKRSPLALCNQAFESWLLYQGEDNVGI